MKIYLSDKIKAKIQDLYNNYKPGSISVRKFRKGKDNEANVISGIKLTDEQRAKRKTGKSYSLSITKKLLKETKKFVQILDSKILYNLDSKNPDLEGDVKTGGFLPLIPLIIAGIGAAGGLAGGAAGIATAVINKQKADAESAESKRHNLEMEKQAQLIAQREKEDAARSGGCVSCSTLPPPRGVFVEPGLREIPVIKKGGAAYLNPYGYKTGGAAYLNPYSGSGLSKDIKQFIDNSKLDPIAKKSLRNFLKNLQTHFKIEKSGNGILIS